MAASASALLRVQWEDGAAILRADVIALTVQLRRVMRGKEHVEQISIGNDRRVKADADGFGMAGCAAAHLFIGRVLDAAADISAFHVADPGQLRNTASTHQKQPPATIACWAMSILQSFVIGPR
jgi:hypothetical protein